MTQPDSPLEEITTEMVTSADGTSLGVRCLGSGSPVVIVHGSISTAESWLQVASQLAVNHRVFVLDRRGRGLSGDAPEYTLGTEAADIAAVLALAVESTGGIPTLVGHSYGAICTLEAVRQGSQVASLVLYEPPLPVDGPVAGQYLAPYAAAIAASDNDAAMRIAMEHFIRAPAAETEAIAATPLWGSFLSLAPTWTRELEQIDACVSVMSEYGESTTRTLLLVGEHSPKHLVGASAYLASKLPDVTKQVLASQSHFANLVDPGSVAAAIDAFSDR
ncbi:alpha/beta hydrolase [Rhodococcus sp. 14-2483-1-1]|uniref:alpha/beta fold hydrolase n=1 Tax=Rhodococcus sp. 14-2483-1-1 TaxID=2023148 RepID=UPI000B9B9799|nr:alpha/beta hydrolase [Rhodococcus sp. 14-2483-1-1]OZF30807.1 alpha/beta hydrolase [Rhodococcus sp. 14-2483-1-1]